ncbi:MAG: endonuclease domain-containing protein [Dehalococcoidia bacterium]|nr:endonuclease domain-containing protein [Dehalococcoidia bacterium]
MRAHATDAERALWQALRRRRFAGHKFRRQQPLGHYVVDFVCLEQRLIVEVDGSRHRGSMDARRDEWLRAEGFRVLRFWDSEVLTQLDSVEQTIWNALGDEGGRE